MMASGNLSVFCPCIEQRREALSFPKWNRVLSVGVSPLLSTKRAYA